MRMSSLLKLEIVVGGLESTISEPSTAMMSDGVMSVGLMSIGLMSEVTKSQRVLDKRVAKM